MNDLDEVCRTHDIAYDKNNSLRDRHRADAVLEDQAWEVFKSKNSGIGEKAAAWAVTTAMKVKRKIGGGGVSTSPRKNGSGCCGFKAVVRAAEEVLKRKKKKKKKNGKGKKAVKTDGENGLIKLAKNCVAVARKAMGGKNNNSKTPRIIHIPKKGGVLPLIPIFAGLSALGALTGGVTSVIKTAREVMSTGASKSAPIHLGKGLYLTPYKGDSYKLSQGDGLHLSPYKGAGIIKKTEKN